MRIRRACATLAAMSEPAKVAALPAREGYGSGCYRRAIALQAAGGEVRGELEDDFHHFAVRIAHDGEVLREVEGEDIRVPWTTCPGALMPLRRMQGAALTLSLLEAYRHASPREQCTHLHDLACLALVHAGRVLRGGAPNRRYDVSLPDRVEGGTTAQLERDGCCALRWTLQGQTLEASEPEGFEGLRVSGKHFYRRLRDLPDPELVEAAWILQRAVFVGMGRRHDFDAMATAEAFAPVGGSACHSFAPERVANARRVRGSVRDFSADPERLLT